MCKKKRWKKKVLMLEEKGLYIGKKTVILRFKKLK